jgi:hypothetical protein
MSRLRLSGDGHGKIGQIHAQAAFGVDRCFRRDVGGGYGNPQLLRLPRARLATATPKNELHRLQQRRNGARLGHQWIESPRMTAGGSGLPVLDLDRG